MLDGCFRRATDAELEKFAEDVDSGRKAHCYVKRMSELSREAKIRFGEAVRKRIETAGRKRI